MRRPAAQEKTFERIRAWRAICPDLTIRSTFIVGFPGETEDDFRFLIDWLDEAKLDRVGAFQYEPVKGAGANALGLEPVPDDIKASRHKRFMARAQAISAKKLAAKVGKRLEVIIDEGGAREAKGRTKGDSPRSTAPSTSRRGGRCAPATSSRSELSARTLTIYGGPRRDGHAPRAQGQKTALNRPEPITSPHAGVPFDGLPNPQRLMAFSTLAMAIAMAVLDGTIVTVALPTMARQFAVAPENAIWIVNAFQLAVTVSLLPLAALGDMLGYRRVYWWGLALFTVASLACALAPTFAVLTFARVVQGLGAAGIMSVNIALIRFVYPHARLGQGVGNMAVVVAICSAGSPSVAAAILSVASWHWLFLINVPIGVLALIMAARTLPATPRAAGRLDLPSVILNALTFGLVIAGVNGIGQGGVASLALIEIAVGAAFGAALVWRQLKLPAPLLPVDLLRRPVFALSLATSIVSFGAQSLAIGRCRFSSRTGSATRRRPPDCSFRPGRLEPR